MRRAIVLLALLLGACATTDRAAEEPRPQPLVEGAPEQEADPVPESLSLTDVLRLSREAPVNLAARIAIDRASGNLEEAGLAPNPYLRVSAERIDTDDFSHGPRKYTIRAFQRLETAGKRAHRTQLADAEIREAEWEERIVNISLARSAAGTHQEALAADRLLSIHEEMDRATVELVALVEAQVNAGRIPEAALAPLRARAGRHRVLVEDARARRLRALHDLAGVLSLPAGSVKSVTGEFLVPGELPEDGDPDANPEVALREAETETARARTKSADSRAYPDVTVGVGYANEDPKGFDTVHSLGIFLEVSLPFIDRNQGEIRASVAEARRSEQLTDAERTRVAAEYALTLDLIRSGTANRNTWIEGILPVLVRDREFRSAEFAAGRTDRAALLEARIAELDAAAAAVEVESRLAALVLDALALLGRPPEEWAN